MKKRISKSTIKHEIAVKGIPASPGIAIGPVVIYTEPILNPEVRIIPKNRIKEEIKRFKKAIHDSRVYLSKVYDETVKNYGQEFADVINTQIAILDDKVFLAEVEQLIREKQYDAPYSTFEVFRQKKEYLLSLSDEYFRDRAFDVQSLKFLILRNLLGKKLEFILKKNSIVIADNLTPADTIQLHRKNILGFCTNVGGKNSHTAIIARSLGVPAVVGTEIITDICHPGDAVALDGNDGIIIVNPSKETIEAYRKKQNQFLIFGKSLLKKADKPAQTTDGKHIKVYANIEFEEELDQVIKSGAEGIGLYRTEGLYLNRNSFPSEDQQVENYLKIAKAMSPRTVIIRTLDIGGDKLLPEYLGMPERNPFLGWRAIRFCLDHKEIFIPQLKAILKSNIYRNVQILLPMVSSIEEIHQFKEVFEETKKVLESEGKEFNPDIKIGMMVEIPSAALMAESFAKEIDFFSIGTNDLTQYTLAVDRANEKISHLYNHFHPALLQLIKHVVDIGKSTNTPVSMCGEMAGDPVAVPLLLGMGMDHLSAAHIAIPEIKNVIRHLSLKECESLYEEVKKLHTASDIQKTCEDFFRKIFTDYYVPINNNNEKSSKG